MEPDLDIYDHLGAIDWFMHCGSEAIADLPFQYKLVQDASSALSSAVEQNWEDAGTEAQGDLTEYLAKNHSDSYGGHWNRLGDEIEAQLRSEIMPRVNKALAKIGAEGLSDSVLLDLSRIGLWASYKKRFNKVPGFFGDLLKVYESGHLPCGWIGDLDNWPEGTLVIY